jgi:cytidylate kinase
MIGIAYSFVVIVTISNLFGCGAYPIAQRVAEELGYALIDRQLPAVVAGRMEITQAQAEAVDETGRSLAARLLASLERATPETAVTGFGAAFDEEYVREIQSAVRDVAAHGNVVILGRGAGAILGRRTDVLRAFVHAPRDWRIERVSGEYGLDRKAAAAELDRIDRARRAHLRDWYGVELDAPEIIDLALDAATFGGGGCAQIIVAAVHAGR